MFRLKPPLAFPLSRLIQVGVLVLFFVSGFIPVKPAHAEEPPPIVPDGWRTFTTANAPIAPGQVKRIFEDSQGQVWIVTTEGLSRSESLSVYKDGIWQTFTEKDGVAKGGINAITGDRAGRVWVGTSGGVSVYADGAWQTFTEKDGLAVSGVYPIVEDHAGRMWVGTSGGLSMYAGGAWQMFTTKDGLTNGGVRAIVEDRAGRVWVGTSGGISVYAGGMWQTFTEKDGLTGGQVEQILEDRAGRVWVGTSGGVSLYAGGVWQTFTEKDGLAGYIFALLEDRAGQIWVGTDGGVSVYAGGAWQTFTEKEGLAAGEVDAILGDRTGRVWVGTDGGVSVYTGGVWQTYRENNGLARGSVSAIMEDRFGRIWIGTGGWPAKGGVSVFTNDVWQTFSMKEGLARGSVYIIMEDSVGRIWIGTGEWPDIGGVSVYVGGAWQTFNEKDRLATGGVKTIAEDSVGRVWIGNADYTRGTGGVSIYTDGTWQTFMDEDGLAAGPVNAIARDHTGRMWVATDSGVSVYESGAWHTYTENNGFTAGGANAILVDHTGRVWAGADAFQGVSVYADGTWQTFTQADGLSAGRVETIMEDAVGQIWIGTANETQGTGGARVYNSGRWRIFTEFHFGQVYIIIQDHTGRIWIGAGSEVPGVTGSIIVYRNEEWQLFAEKDILTVGFVVAILEDRTGRIWIGTADHGRGLGGVSVYTNDRWQAITEKNGLAAGPVKTIFEDSNGCIWVGTQSGVSVYIDGVWHTFTTKDGLAAGGVQVIFEDHIRRVWIGTENGISVKRPPIEPPWVLVKSVFAQSKAIPYKTAIGQSVQSINLSPGSYSFQIEFSGGDMDSRQENLFFRYRLEGREQEWHITKAYDAQYTDLGPGDYTFAVKSVDEDALESPSATLKIRIERFWWQSPVAWAGGVASLGLLVLGTVLGTQRWRRKRQLDAWRKGHDPYIVGAVIEEPDKFYGREDTLTELVHALESGNHMALYGERRIGKTSLLHQLTHRLEQTKAFVPVFIEMQVVSQDNFFLALMSAIAKAVRARTDIGPLKADKQPAQYKAWDMASDLDIVFDSLRQQGADSSRIVLLLDEADKMNHYDPHIQEALRGLLMHTGEHISLVWSGQTMDREWKLDTSPWYNLFKREIHLAGIDKAAADRLIRQPVKGVYEYDDDAVERIFQYSNYEPYRIQRLCSACVRRLLDAGRGRVTVEDVDAAYQALAAEDGRQSSESSAPVSYQVLSPARQVAEKKADYHKDADP